MCIRHICNYTSNSYSFVNVCCDSMIFREKERERESAIIFPRWVRKILRLATIAKDMGQFFLFLKWIPGLMLLMNWENHITLLEGYGI